MFVCVAFLFAIVWFAVWLSKVVVLVSLRVLLFLAGVVLAVLGNVIRAFSLSYIASQKGIEAVETAHDAAGWTILGFTVVGVLGVTWLLGEFEKQVHSRKMESET